MTMSFFSKLFGQPQPPPLPASGSGAIGHTLPLGLRVGGQVEIDTTLYRMAPEAMTAELPAGTRAFPATVTSIWAMAMRCIAFTWTTMRSCRSPPWAAIWKR